MSTPLRLPKAVYKWERHGNVLAIVDLWSARLPTRSVTNDIEAVLDNLRQEGHLRLGDRVIYRDTEQRWDEVAIDAECRFAEFRPLGADTAEAAIAKLQEQAP